MFLKNLPSVFAGMVLLVGTAFTADLLDELDPKAPEKKPAQFIVVDTVNNIVTRYEVPELTDEMKKFPTLSKEEKNKAVASIVHDISKTATRATEVKLTEKNILAYQSELDRDQSTPACFLGWWGWGGWGWGGWGGCFRACYNPCYRWGWGWGGYGLGCWY